MFCIFKKNIYHIFTVFHIQYQNDYVLYNTNINKKQNEMTSDS